MRFRANIAAPRAFLTLCCVLLVLAGAAPAMSQEEEVKEAEEEEPAELKVRGYGLLGNRSLKRTLEFLYDTEDPPAFFTATHIEDGALLLLAQLQQDGYLGPEVEAKVTRRDGEEESFVWEKGSLVNLPRPIRATTVEFHVDPGTLYYYETLEFEGLTVVEEEEAEEYFIATGFLFETKRARVFTPEGLEDGLSNIREVLARRGYEQARAVASHMERDDETGAVNVAVSVTEGPRSMIRDARAVVTIDGEREKRPVEVADDQFYSRIWAQDRAQELRSEFYERGYPDTEVAVDVESRTPDGNLVWVDLVFRVEPGPYVEVGEVIFRGHDQTKESVLRRRVELSPGDPLDRLKVDESRYRLSRLGIFEWVEAEFEEVDEHTRNIVFDLREGREIDVSLLFGYGSYEMFRGGLEIEQFNLFGRAHRSRLLLVQSMRSSSVNYRYMVPELFGEDIHGFSSAFALRREEPDFDRQEFGATTGLQTLFYRIDLDAGLSYTYELLESRAGIATGVDGLDKATVTSVGLDLQRDLRDNPIYPERGHNMTSHLEMASEALGGEVDYQRLELGASYHKDIGSGTFIHLALRHGVLHTSGLVEEEIPLNRRYYTGGESTIRGYVEGEASPRNEDGDFVGSETYSLLNLELEQALTRQWSVVLFSDSVGFARRLDDYPYDETLFSVGLGIRYKTLIGPVRLEYGHNLNPRPDDPSGSVHLSIGFPF